MSKLSGKVAIVTGASKGIGASIAEHLAAEGASVVVNYSSSKSGADAVVERITKAGGKAIAVGANVAKPEEIAKLISETVKAYGKINVLVNNAGIYDFAPLEAITPEHFHKQFDLNVLGLLLTTQAAVKEFPEEGGSIINISSVVGKSAQPNAAVYSATKGAVDAVTLSLARELGPKKIRVNSVSPGLVETEGTAGFMGSDFHKTIEAQTPLGRIGQPDDIGKVVAFFASDDSTWISGEAVLVAGGSRG
ncbi:SDR family NAD(P)-dependent oxidoreductase [Granulicella tundricola]|uniref:Short-chain dehydrogenase/reductase SDR n=1 Tax=Granulicella tundricola (strain ATCC BAA-1859 / DSM 23138 / MP5ACTX9) TaxID=1198114 RepID=E8WZU9_GRATM|nr:glucose 1-dehydrogenase [Granulicella tundricola]ADW67760.1 short-chain dehydrogenase/reductase SDR [Granulicella tundricola MP5ACTX9]